MPIQVRKFFSFDDPTFVATALAIVSVPLWNRPWGWSCVRPPFEANWVILSASQALAAAAFCATPGVMGGWALVAILLVAAPWIIGSEGGSWMHHAAFLLPDVARRLFDSRMIGWLTMWVQFACVCAAIARTVRPRVRFDSLLAWSSLATAAAVMSQYAGEILIGGGWRAATHEKALVILAFATPAIVLPAMLWRLVRLGEAPAVVIGLSTIALAATAWPFIGRGRHPLADAGLLIAFAGSGVAWAILRRRFCTPMAETRGFAVVTSEAVT